MDQSRIPEVSVSGKTPVTMNKLEYKLRVAMVEQIQSLCETCARYLGLGENSIDPTLLWKPLNELPETIADLKNDEDDELQLNAFMLQARFGDVPGVSIAHDIATKIQEAVQKSFNSGNDSWNNPADYEMGILQMIHDLAKEFGFDEVREYAKAFRYSDIGGGSRVKLWESN